MVFSSSAFVFLFLPMVISIYYVMHHSFKNAFLLAASLVFYAFGEPKFVAVLIVSIIINWGLALLIEKVTIMRLKTFCLVIDIMLNLSMLIIFKYANFITSNLTSLFKNVTVTDIALPIGISFFTFQAMSYVIDVYRGEENAQVNPLNLGLYISLFPQLIAGPIVRYSTISKELVDRKTTWNDVIEGTTCFLRGLFKKIIIANNVAIVADAAFTGNICEHSILFSWLGALAYTLQIYFDFSGYSDMAIGLGGIFGFHFPKNFDYPYAATSITNFWRRWHISLSSWFKDYVYIPLGGSKVEGYKRIRNLLVVWLLTGIWHGANWTFIAWGLLYFMLLIVEKYIIHPEKITQNWIKNGYRIVVFYLVMLLWVLFRSESVRMAGQYIKSMLGLYGNVLADNDWLWYSREYIVFIVFGLLLSTPLIRMILMKVRMFVKSVVYEGARTIGYLSLFITCISYLVTGAHNPFIYFSF